MVEGVGFYLKVSLREKCRKTGEQSSVCLQNLCWARRDENIPEDPTEKGSAAAENPEVYRSDEAIFLSQAHSERFYYGSDEHLWRFLENKDFVVELRVDLQSFEACGFTRYLDDLGLTDAAVAMVNYSPELVREFYSNFSGESDNKDSVWHHQVYVRGTLVDFSPDAINRVLRMVYTYAVVYQYPVDYKVVLEEITSSISGGAETVWPTNEEKFRASSLTLRHFLVYRLMVSNWLVSSNRSVVTLSQGRLLHAYGRQDEINLGNLLFEEIHKSWLNNRTKRMTHPCLITALIRASGINVSVGGRLELAPVFVPTQRSLRIPVVDLPWNFEAPLGINDEELMRLRLPVWRAELRRARQVAQASFAREEAMMNRIFAAEERYPPLAVSDSDSWSLGSISEGDSDGGSEGSDASASS